MTPTLWAPYGDAIKLILTGADIISTADLSSEQQTIFREMLDQGLKDETRNKRDCRYLQGVQTQPYCVDKEKKEYETYYYIPDLFLYMFSVFPDWSILSPPVDLDYLNSLRDEVGNHLFLYSDAPGHKEWENSEGGLHHWDLVCRRLEILKEIDELNLTNHQNDPLRLEAQKRMKSKLEKELKSIDKDLASFESTNLSDIDFIAYPKAFQQLDQRLNTSPEEMAAWIWVGPENGGVAAYTNADELDPAPRFHYSDLLGEDYLSPLMECWFQKTDIANFEPEERFITGKALIEKWSSRPGVKPRAYIEAKVAESRLMDYHPTLGGTSTTDPQDSTLPPLETGLFSMLQVNAIETEEFGSAKDNGSDDILPVVGSPEWRKANARKAANARHDKPGGTRDKQRQIREIWASGKYSSRNICAEEECAALNMSFATARSALKNTPDP